MADRIVVMNHGYIDQIGSPEAIYHSPATPFVADFVGVMNFLPGRAGPGPENVRCGTLNLQSAEPHGFATDSPILLSVRPEDVRLGHVDPTADNVAMGCVEETEFLGAFYRVTLALEELGASSLLAEVSANRVRDLDIKKGRKIPVRLPPDLLRVYPDNMGVPT